MQRLSSLWRRSSSLRYLLAGGTTRFNSKPDSTSRILRDNSPKRLAHATVKMAPSIHEQPSAKETFGNLDLIKRIKLGYTDVIVSKWRSRVTGLTVVHLDYEGAPLHKSNSYMMAKPLYQAPIVNGYFVVPTESSLVDIHGLRSVLISDSSFRRQWMSSYTRAVSCSIGILQWHLYNL